MDAPLYPPAQVFVPPRRVPRPLSVAETPLATLRANPAAWRIVTAEIPGLDRRLESMKPHLNNFSLESLLPFGVVPREALDRIDPQLRALGVAP